MQKSIVFIIGSISLCSSLYAHSDSLLFNNVQRMVNNTELDSASLALPVLGLQQLTGANSAVLALADSGLFGQIETGIKKYQTLNDTQPYVAGRVFAFSDKAFEEVKFTYSEREFDYFVGKSFFNENLAFTAGFGFLGSDAKKINDTENIQLQKSPYVLLGVGMGDKITENTLVAFNLRLKESLDRADMEHSIGLNSNLAWKSWAFGVGYEKIFYNGFKDNENLQFNVSYSMKF